MKTFRLFLFALLLIPAWIVSAEDAIPVYGDSIDIEPPGSAMTIYGNTLYMTFCGSAGIVAAFDISVPDRPRLTSTFRTGFFPQGIAFEPNTKKLYVADGRYVSVLSASNPGKLALLERYLISDECIYGPSDIFLENGKPVIACRAGGVVRGLHSRKKLTEKYARTLLPEKDGYTAVSRHSVIRKDGREVIIPIGTPRRIRHFLEYDGLSFLANGFSGLAVISENDVYVTESMVRHSTYGACVYDVVPGSGNGLVLLAAGEIGIVTADVSDLKNGIRYVADCTALRWNNVTGIIRGPGSLVYVCDDSFG